MKNLFNKKIIMLILLVFIVSFGFTYAFFSVGMFGNENANSEIVTTEYLGEIRFQDGVQINADRIYPGWTTSKNIVINADSDATSTVPYSVSLHINSNTFVEHGDDEGYIEYKVVNTSPQTINDGSVFPNYDGWKEVKLENGVLEIISDAVIGPSGSTHTYEIYFRFPEKNIIQNSQQGKEFSAYLQINGYSNEGISQLHIENTIIKNSEGKQIILKGLSTHGIQWYGDDVTQEVVDFLKYDMKMNTLRVAMYTDQDGYIDNPTTIKAEAKRIIDLAIENNLYVVIDWHILYDNDPNTYVTQAIEFFDEISEEYGNLPNIIYEICNEPNEDEVTWNVIKNYANQVIPVIRANDPDGIIVVGTPSHSSNFEDVILSPLSYSNIMYTYHIYSNSDATLNVKNYQEINSIIENGLPIFITETGNENSVTGNLVNVNSLYNYFENNKISYILWGISDTSSSGNHPIFIDGYKEHDSYVDYLTPSTLLLYNILNNNYPTMSSSTPAGTIVKSPSTWSKNVYGVSDGNNNIIPVPLRFYYVGGTKDTGVVISDNEADRNAGLNSALVGNQYVFIPTNDEMYNRTEWNQGQTINILSEPLYRDEYDDYVNRYSGFYISRYEAGYPEEYADTWNSSLDSLNQIAIPRYIEGLPLWNKVAFDYSKKSAALTYSFRSKTHFVDMQMPLYAYDTVVSDLMSSYAWDAVLNFITSDSNYSTYITNTYDFETRTGTLSSTLGGNYIKNISNFGGNSQEWTTEYSSQSADNYVLRGGRYDSSSRLAGYRNMKPYNYIFDYSTFRTMLYIK